MKLHNMDLNQKWKVGEKTGSKDPPRYIGHSVITAWLKVFRFFSGSSDFFKAPEVDLSIRPELMR